MGWVDIVLFFVAYGTVGHPGLLNYSSTTRTCFHGSFSLVSFKHSAGHYHESIPSLFNIIVNIICTLIVIALHSSTKHLRMCGMSSPSTVTEAPSFLGKSAFAKNSAAKLVKDRQQWNVHACSTRHLVSRILQARSDRSCNLQQGVLGQGRIQVEGPCRQLLL